MTTIIIFQLIVILVLSGLYVSALSTLGRKRTDYKELEAQYSTTRQSLNEAYEVLYEGKPLKEDCNLLGHDFVIISIEEENFRTGSHRRVSDNIYVESTAKALTWTGCAVEKVSNKKDGIIIKYKACSRCHEIFPTNTVEVALLEKLNKI